MQMAKDYYDILGGGKGASTDDIRKAYRNLALKFHPDINKNKEAEARMREINEAYAVLSDADKKKQYDTFGPEGFGKRFTADDIFRGVDFEDIIRQFQEGVFTGGGGPFTTDIFEQPEQTGVNLYIPFDEIERGSEKEYEVQRQKTCENCKGTGGDPGSKITKCPQCNGTGNVHVQQNTMFGRFSMVSTCNKCRGRGRTYERTCKECRGNGKILVREKFRVKVDTVGKENKESKKGRFWVF